MNEHTLLPSLIRANIEHEIMLHEAGMLRARDLQRSVIGASLYGLNLTIRLSNGVSLGAICLPSR